MIGTKASGKLFRAKSTKEIGAKSSKALPAKRDGARAAKELVSKEIGDTGRPKKRDDKAGRPKEAGARAGRPKEIGAKVSRPIASKSNVKSEKSTTVKQIGSRSAKQISSRADRADKEAGDRPAKQIGSRPAKQFGSNEKQIGSRSDKQSGGNDRQLGSRSDKQIGSRSDRQFSGSSKPDFTANRPKKAFSSRADIASDGSPEAETEEPELIYGKQAVLTALQSNRAFNRIWLTERLRYDPRFLRLIDDAKSSGAVIDIVNPKRLDQMTDNGNHQGVAAQTAAHAYTELEELLILAEGKTNPAFLAADGIEDPYNLGALIRSAEALGFLGILIPRRRAVGVTATVAKVAAGAVEHLPIARVTNLNQALERFKEAGFQVVGAQEKASKPLYEVDLAGPLVVVIGSEGNGISLLTQRHCDQIVSIPLSGKTPSLNASVAGGIVLYEVVRQRLGKKIDMR